MFSSLNGSHCIKDCITRNCGNDGCDEVYNRLFQKSVKSVESAVNREKNLTTISNANVQGAFQLVPIRVHENIGSHQDTMTLCVPTRYRHWLIKSCWKNSNWMKRKWQFMWLVLTAPHQFRGRNEVEVTFGPAESTAAHTCTVLVNSYQKLAVGKEEHNWRSLKQNYEYLSCIRQKTTRLCEVKSNNWARRFPLYLQCFFQEWWCEYPSGSQITSGLDTK